MANTSRSFVTGCLPHPPEIMINRTGSIGGNPAEGGSLSELPDLAKAAHRVQTLSQLAELLRWLRRRHARRQHIAPLTVRELASRSGYSRGAVAEYLSGRTLAPTDRFDVLVGLLGASTVEQGALATARDRVEERRRARTGPGAMARQLPPGVPGFTGRERELATLDLLDQRSPAGPDGAAPVAVIAGAAGVGKTALAVHWAHRVAGRFPDGQLYVDLRGYAAAAPLTPLQALARFLRALGVPADQVPADVDEATAAYRSRLADRRMLVLLDNAADPEQVRPLLPGGRDCVVVVTSRDRLLGLAARDGAQRLELDVLPAGDARALLARLLGTARVDAEPAAVAELVELCGRLPLALRISAANLASRLDLPVGDLLAQLRGADRLAALAVAGDEQAAVAAAFDLSYRRLPEPTRRAFRRIGLVPGPDVTAGALAALLDTTPGRADRELAALAGAHLIEERSPGRYAFHDLLRVYARERAAAEEPPVDAAGARRRLYGYYHRAADQATSLLYPIALRLPGAVPAGGGDPPPAATFRDPPEALRWLDGELPNLVAAVQQAATGDTPAAAWLISNGLRGYLQRSAPTADALVIVETALAAAEAAGDRLAAGCVRLGRASLRFRLGYIAGALADSAAALAALGEARWVDGQAAALGNLAHGHGIRGELRQSVGYLQAAAERFGRAGSPGRVAVALADLPVPLLVLGRRQEAVRYARLAADRAAETGWEFIVALNRTNRGTLHWLLGELGPARECFARALAHFRRCGDLGEQSSALSGLAEVHCDRGRPGLAATLARAGQRIARSLEEPYREAGCWLALARIHHRCREPVPARQAAARALALAQQVGDRYAQGRALLALAAALRLDPASHPAARSSVDAARELARSGGLRLLEGQALTESAEIWLAAGDPDRAVAHARRALAAHRETGHRPGELRTRALLSQLAADPAVPVPATGPSAGTRIRSPDRSGP
jgi:tetratricopeptide (TPR) repeat protein/transcriptional regulator with XRE-family HTH domain